MNVSNQIVAVDGRSYNSRLADAGIKTIRSGATDARGNIVLLEFNGKRIRRPAASIVVDVVREEFGVEI